MSLHPIVAALGGDLYQGGRRANVPAPGHSQADRSVSLLLEGDRLVIHGFGAADWQSELTAWKSARSVGGAKTLRPAATPRLPGMARRAPVREAAVPLKPQPETRSFLTPAPSERPSGLATVKPVRKRAGRAVSIDQIDFGF